MISDQKALDAATVIVQFCKEQISCENCIFRKFGVDRWGCHIGSFDLEDVLSNKQAKKKHHGFIT